MQTGDLLPYLSVYIKQSKEKHNAFEACCSPSGKNRQRPRGARRSADGGWISARDVRRVIVDGITNRDAFVATDTRS